MSPLASGLTNSILRTGSSTVSDQYFNNVSLLVLFEGVNNSITFTDRSKNSVQLTSNGYDDPSFAKITTTKSKFGASSGSFLSAGGYVSLPKSDLFVFGSGDFTIEAWIYPLNPTAVTGTERNIFGMWSAVDAGGQAFALWMYNGSLQFIADIITNDRIIFSISNVIVSETWYHVAITRSSTNMYCFIDGILQGTSSVGTSSIVTGNNTFGIGGYNRLSGASQASFGGYIDSLRVTKGIARYTSDFFVPTREFANF